MGEKEKRADAFLRDRFPFLTKRQVLEAIEYRLVNLVGGDAVKKGDRVTNLDVVGLGQRLEAIRCGTPDLPVKVIREEGDWMLLDKGAGVTSHALSLMERDSLNHWCWAERPDVAASFPSPLSPLTPHRLDTGTSGAIVLCKNPKSYEQWREAFSRHGFTKTYLAWCWGLPRHEKFQVNASLSHHPSDSSRMVPADRGRPPIMEAWTEFRVVRIERELSVSLVEATCYTGATHQVRVHLAMQGHPLVGDTLYDDVPRPFTSEHHWLRAVSLSGDALDLHVDSAEFEASLPSLMASADPSKAGSPGES